MTYLAVYRSEVAAIATDSTILPASEVHAFQSAAELAQVLEQTVCTAEQCVQEQRERAHQEGFAAGFADGQNHAREQFANRVAALARELQAERGKMQRDVASLAVRIVRRIASDIGAPQTVAALADGAVRELLGYAPITIRVHPYACAAVQAHLQSTAQMETAHSAPIQVRADETLKVYGCVLETHAGTTIASLDTQLKRIEEALIPALRGAHAAATAEASAGSESATLFAG
jgi:type III secretion protein L